MTTTTNDSRVMLEVIPVVLDSDDNVITKGVAHLLTLEEFVARLPAASEDTAGTVLQMEVQDPAVAADVAALKTQFDALLTKLKAAGLMASA
jgi:hypothetical protein